MLKEINPEYSLEGLMLKLKLLIQRADSLEKTLNLGKERAKLKASEGKNWTFWSFRAEMKIYWVLDQKPETVVNQLEAESH